MRRILYIVVLLTLLALPAERMDIGRLIPIETLYVTAEEGNVRMKTDMGNAGTGRTVKEAYLDLRAKASGEVFLDTVEYLLLSGNGEPVMDELKQYLRPDVRVCRCGKIIDLAAVSEYLSVHEPKYRLKECGMIPELEELVQKEDGFTLE